MITIFQISILNLKNSNGHSGRRLKSIKMLLIATYLLNASN